MDGVLSGVAEPGRLGRTSLPDGRALGWAEWGPEDGTPVLLCPGAATSRWLGFGADVVHALDVRLISVDRPGLGASDPQPDRELTDWADDIAQLFKARGITKPAVVGFSQGAPFALACAAAGITGSVALVSAGDELAQPGFADLLVPDVRRTVELAVNDPGAATELFAGMSADAMWDMVITMSGEDDRAVYTDLAFARAYRQAMAECFVQGPAGYARDTVLAMRPWPFDLAAITVPVHLWFGANDTSPVHSPDFGESLAQRMPTAQRTIVDSAGGAILWTHSERVLRSICPR
ncbi:alpha/beta fold hydrolase [Allokutzneria albata]|uniref:Pimeloyl-ACP methyl ester carboxylesterase n=1 Tax=Allokutzneria albata TaxID=211114 RepID=A0A1G9TC94_ALLAB|nr:alpha/beta hydrolase [Allokutzneria albata]SDM45277.1 Pimeloyl-ACP methyl ester carboxylesterase [Allokutzneria albata]